MNCTVSIADFPADVRLSKSPGVTYSGAMTIDLDDSALMFRYRDGDDAAFEVLYRRHNDALYRYLLHLCLNRDAAEDIFQETWGKIIRARDRYRQTAKFRTYLFRVAHNCFIDYLRRNKRHEHSSTADPDDFAASGEPPELDVEKALARQRLILALASLPDEQRDVFLLHEEGGLSIDQIALVTGVKRETAKSRLRYAVRKLKAEFAQLAGGSQNHK